MKLNKFVLYYATFVAITVFYVGNFSQSPQLYLFTMILLFFTILLINLLSIKIINRNRHSKTWFGRAMGKGSLQPKTWQGLLIQLVYLFGFPIVAVVIFGLIDLYYPDILPKHSLSILLILFSVYTLLYMVIAYKKKE